MNNLRSADWASITKISGLVAVVLSRAVTSLCVVLLVSCTGAGPDGQDGTGAVAQEPADAWMYRYATFPNTKYGSHPEQSLDLYVQGTWTGEPTYFERAPDSRPTLMFIHGGGWVVRDRRPESFVLPFVRRGWHVASIQYRIGPGTAPMAVDDAVCALDWLVRNADKYGFDRDKIVIAGASAGGHLSLTTGILASRTEHKCAPGNGFRVHSVVNWFGISDIAALSRFLDANPPDFGNYALSWIGDEARVAEISAAYSPIHMLHDDSPPVLTIHGTDDSVVPYDQAVVLHERLEALGIRNELLALDGGNHAGFTDAQFAQAFAAMLNFAEAE